MSTATSKFRNWCFTCNNYTQADYDAVKALKYKYLIIGFEVGDSGTRHLQGYLELPSQLTFSSLSKKIPKFHLEHRKGTAQQASDYCKKGGEFDEYGKLSHQGQRNDINSVCASISQGKSFEDILDEATSYQSLQIAKVAMPYKEPKRDWVPFVYWYWGPPGTGKTHAAFNSHPDTRVHKQAGSTKWWQGYDRHDVVIIDDLRRFHIDFVRLLELLDRYPTTVENKGGSRQFVPRYIYVTAPYPPDEMYADEGENLEQLIRRITEVRYFKDKYLGPIISNNNGDEDESSSIVQEGNSS